MTRNITEYMKYINEKERNQILEFANTSSPAIRLCVHMMDKVGLRVGEAIKVNIKDIDFDNEILKVYAPKQKKIIERVMPKSLIKRIKVHIKQFQNKFKDGYLMFTDGHGAKGPHIKTNTIYWFFHDFRKTYEYTDPYYIRQDGNNLYRHASHVLRSNFITKFYEASGYNARLTQLEVGHVKIHTTMGYVRFADRQQKVRETLKLME